MIEVEVAVVGAGVMGLATAWRLARAGVSTIVLERNEVGHDRGSSHGPSRIFRFAYEHVFYVRLAQLALPLWRELEEEAGEPLLDLTGGFDIGSARAIEPVARALSDAGATFERVARASARIAGVASDDPAIASPDTGVVAASASVRALARVARASGVEIRERTHGSIERAGDDGVELRAGDERVRARTCVVSAGAWVRPTLGAAVASPPVTVTMEHVGYFRERQPIPVLIFRGEGIPLYALPQRFSSPGARAAGHHAGPEIDPDDRPPSDPAAIETLSAAVRTLVPALDPEPLASETCLYTTTPDESFVIDRAGPVVVASPCSGHGFKFAPIVGEISARIAIGAPPPLDVSPLRLARFARRR